MKTPQLTKLTAIFLAAGVIAAPQLTLAQTPPKAVSETPSNDPSKVVNKPKQLGTVNIEAEADKADGVRATSTRVGKTLQDPHDIPQALTTVTKTLMDQQQVGSLREALRNVSGLTFNAAEGGRSGDNMNLRGFYTFGDMYLDGIRDTAQYNRETFNLEQIDVLRGAGAMLFGRGQAGGVINQVSKLPFGHFRAAVNVTGGAQNFREGTADINVPLSDNAGLRINAMQRDEGSWRSNPLTGAEPEIHRKGLAFSLGANLHTDSQVWLNYTQLATNDNPDYGVSFDPATRKPSTILPASTFWGSAQTFDDSDSRIASLVHEWRLGPGQQLRTQVRDAQYLRSYWAKTPNLITPPNALNGVGGNPSRTSNYRAQTVQSDYSLNWKLAGMAHETIAGIEYLREKSDRNSLQNFGLATAPDYRPYTASSTAIGNKFTGDSYALYAQDTVEFTKGWKLTAGLRRDKLDAQYSSITSPNLSFGENSTRLAMSYHPNAESHFYVGASDSFSPTADLYQLTVAPQPAERSKVIEVGTKYLAFDGDLALRAALYRAGKVWERNADLESTAAILTKKRRTDGLELEAAGRINEHWEIFAGIALMRATILEVAQNINATTGVLISANPEYAGKRARNTPKYTYNLWTTYDLTSQLKIGGGVEAKGDRHGVNPSGAGPVPTLDGAYQPNTAPSYARCDAMAEYKLKDWTFRLNAKNVFNKLYYDAVYDNGGFSIPGAKRLISLNVQYRF